MATLSASTARFALRDIAPHQRIFVGSGAAEPAILLDALVADSARLAGNEVVHILTLGPAPYVRPELSARFRHVALFVGANVRDAVQQGRADYLPIFLSEAPELLRSHLRPDVALIQVSPPDAHGCVSLGVSVDVVRAAIESAELVIAEVNPRMPRTHGDSFVHVSRIDRLVDVSYPLPTIAPAPTDDVAKAIALHVASLIPDGATLQIGIGAIPDAVLGALTRHQELGIHSEMISDGVMTLADAGVITGRRKADLPGKIVTSFVMGGEALYRWVDDNPVIEMRPSDYTNDPAIISRNERMISVNSALAVDLTGQVCADSVGQRVYSGIGGQVDFIRGASRSRGGKAIVALRSTAGPNISRICGALETGAAVTTSRGDVRFVVTEHGVADLWGKTLRQRAEALIAIAHPDFRPELTAAALHRRLIGPPAHDASSAFARVAHSLRG